MNKNTGSITGLSVNGKSNGRFGLFVVLAAISTMAFAGMAGYASADPGISAPSVGNSVASLTNSTAASVTFSSSETRPYTFECSTDGSAWTLCTSPQTLTGLADGSHSVQVRQVVQTSPAVAAVPADPAGCTPTVDCTTDPVDAVPATYATSDVASSSWTVDATAPAALTITTTADRPFGTARPSFAFTGVEAGATVHCDMQAWGDGRFGEISPCTSPFTPAFDLGQNRNHNFYVWQTDAAGNSSPEATLTFRVDVTAPDAPVLTGKPADYTKSRSASIGFTGEANATFTCSVDGGDYSACSSTKDLSDLADGTHSVSVKATDLSGNTSSAATASWTVDNVAPDAPVLSGVPASLVATRSASISASAEANSTLTCSVDGGDYSACTSPKALSDLTDGNHSISVKATDRAGNTGVAVTSSTWEVDGTAPVIALGGVPSGEVQGPAPSGVTNAKKPAWFFTFTDAAGHLAASTATCRIDSGATASACTSPYQAPANLSDGSHTLTVTVADSLGNTRTLTNTFTVDTIAPTASIIDGPSGRSGASVSFHLGSTEDG